MSATDFIISKSILETEALGESWGRAAKRGWVIGISGDLGAGKTYLVKGIARGLEISRKVHSPTFALINEYSDGRLPLFHLDLYRLESREEIIRAGLEEYFYQPKGVAVIEWMERWIGENNSGINKPDRDFKRGAFFRLVKIETLDETSRRISYDDFGA